MQTFCSEDGLPQKCRNCNFSALPRFIFQLSHWLINDFAMRESPLHFEERVSYRWWASYVIRLAHCRSCAKELRTLILQLELASTMHGRV